MMWATSRQSATKPQRKRVPSKPAVTGSVMGHSVPRHMRPAKPEDLRYAKFAFDGQPGFKHAVFVPDHMEVTPLVMEQVCIALDKEMPSMFLVGLSSLSHSSKLSTPQLRKCPGFSPLLAEAQRSLGLSTKASTTSADQSEKLADVVDAVLEKKIGTMVGNITGAAFQTNVWTFTGPRMSVFEIFIQQCLESGEAGAFRLVSAHMQDKAYMGCAVARQLMKDIFDSSQVLSAEAVAYLPPLLLPSKLWDQKANTAHQEFAQHGYDYWSFDSVDPETTAGHPIVQWPWPYGDLFLLFYREENIRGATEADADWEFSTPNWLDEEAISFSPQAFAPICSVCIGSPSAGPSEHKSQLLKSIRQASPVVIMDNTSGIGKQMGTAVRDIQRVWDTAPLTGCRPFLEDGWASSLGDSCSPQEFLGILSPMKILQHAEQEFTASGADEKLMLSDVVVLLDVAKRRPQAFRETVCVMDPLAASASHAVEKLKSVFTSTQACAGEPASTEFQRKLAMRAWDLHLRLAAGASRMWRVPASLMATITLLLLACTILTILSLWCDFGDTFAPGVTQWVLDNRWSLDAFFVAGPVVVLVLMTIQTGFHVSQNWAKMHMAASWVVAELYMYLGNVAPYDKGAAANQQRFLRRLRVMVKGSSPSGMDQDNADQGADTELSPDIDLDNLSYEVSWRLYGRRRGCCPRRCRALRFRTLCGASCWGNGTHLEHVDLVEPVNAESYMELRMQPLRHYYLERVRTAMLFRKCMNSLLALVMCMGIFLGSTEKCFVWLPVALAVANVLMSLSNWLLPPAFLPAVNNALMVFQKLDLHWQGSDLRENRSEETKNLMIRSTESAVLDVERALARAMPMLEGLDALDDEDRNDAVGNGSRSSRGKPITVASSKAMNLSGQVSVVPSSRQPAGSDGLYSALRPGDSLLGG